MDEEEFFPTFADLVHLDPRFEFKTRILSWEEGNMILPRSRGGCWEWTGRVEWSGKNRNRPYARIRRKGASRKTAPVYGHKYVWELFWGTFPEGHEGHHECWNSRCIHPGHIIPIDPYDHDVLHNRARGLGYYNSKRKRS